jgi:hypothetical protein
MVGLGDRINNIDEAELLVGANQPHVVGVDDDNAPAPQANGSMH